MSLTDELLATVSGEVVLHEHVVTDPDNHFVIDPDSRQIENATEVRNTLMQYDHNSEVYTFELPRYVEGHDMSLCNRVRVHFINVDGTTGNEHADVAEMDDLTVSPSDPDKVLSTWTIRREATQLVGSLSFAVQYMCVADDGTVTYEWHTDVYSDVDVKRSLDNSEAAVVEYTNILEEWYQKLFDGEGSTGTVSDEQIAQAVSNYMTENPVEVKGVVKSINDIIPDDSGAIQLTASDVGALPDTTVIPTVPSKVSELENDSGYLTEHQDLSEYVKTVNGIAPDESGNVQITIPEPGGGGGSGGMSATASALLINILRNGVYSTDQSANITALAEALTVTEPEQPEEPDVPEVTLTSISATYSGGDVAVGTAVTDLTGVVVTAHYSDGTSETVTGYTLSGTIAEGSNTVTVSYSGKTTTFTVTGIAESGGEASDILYQLATPMTFDGTNGITTETTLDDVKRDYTITVDFEFDLENFSGHTIIDAYKGMNTNGLAVTLKTQAGNKKVMISYNGASSEIPVYFTNPGKQTARVALVRTASDNTLTGYYLVNGNSGNFSITQGVAHQTHSQRMRIGKSQYDTEGFIGTINEFTVYTRAFTADEANSYLEV